MPPPPPPSDGDNDHNFQKHDKVGSLEEYFAQRLEAEGKSINSTTTKPQPSASPSTTTENNRDTTNHLLSPPPHHEQQQERRRIQIPRPTLKFIPLAPETETHYKETIPEEIAAAASHDNGDGNSSGDEDNSLHDIDQDENSDGEDAVWAATTTTTTTNSNADHSNQEEEEEFDTNSYRPRASNPNRFRTYPQLMAKMTTETLRWVTQRKKQQQQKSRQSQKQQQKQPQKKQPLPEGFPTSTRNESVVGEQIEMERLERTIVDTSATTQQTPEYSSFQLGTLSSATNTTAPFKEPPTNRKRETVILNTLGLDNVNNPTGRRRKPRKFKGKNKKKRSYLPIAYDDDDPSPGYHSLHPSKSIRQQLVEQGEQVPWHEYVLLQHIPAVSTLASVLEAINVALDRQVLQQQGILDLEAHVDLQRQDDHDLPILSMSDMFPQLQLEEEHEQQPKQEAAAATDDVDNEDSNEPNNNSNSQEEQHAKQQQPYFPLHDEYRWVQEAKVVLGPFGRPAGWKLKFANRSIASALLAACDKEPLKVAWKIAVVKTWTEAEERRMTRVDPKEGNTRLEIAFAKPKVENPEDVFGNNAMYYDDLDTEDLSWLDETVVRVENCARDVSAKNILNVFSRYELATPSVLFWGSPKHTHNAKGNKTSGKSNNDNDNHISMRPSYWIRFADPSWARAALREKQGVHIGGSPIRLIQFPNQYHGRESLQPKQHDDDSDSQPEAA